MQQVIDQTQYFYS